MPFSCIGHPQGAPVPIPRYLLIVCIHARLRVSGDGHFKNGRLGKTVIRSGHGFATLASVELSGFDVSMVEDHLFGELFKAIEIVLVMAVLTRLGVTQTDLPRRVRGLFVP